MSQGYVETALAVYLFGMSASGLLHLPAMMRVGLFGRRRDAVLAWGICMVLWPAALAHLVWTGARRML